MIKKLFIVAYNSCKDNTKVQINRFLFPFFTEKQQTQTQKKQKEGVCHKSMTHPFSIY